MRPVRAAKTDHKQAEPKALAKSDAITLVIRSEKDGKLRVTSQSMVESGVVLPGQHLKVKWVGGSALVTCEGVAR